MDWLKQECSQKKLFVLPAFETAELPSMAAAHRVAAKAAASSKLGLQKMVDDQQVWQFALKIFREVRPWCWQLCKCHRQWILSWHCTRTGAMAEHRSRKHVTPTPL
jgi:hypothetical protein